MPSEGMGLVFSHHVLLYPPMGITLPSEHPGNIVTPDSQRLHHPSFPLDGASGEAKFGEPFDRWRAMRLFFFNTCTCTLGDGKRLTIEP
mmetsp:Transcript_80772/g.135101  ORF Transcript_80772/g.135101 Transcript_80772/m.135101 type:complete len:89 (+) Transcript_80772:897-1163(+)